MCHICGNPSAKEVRAVDRGEVVSLLEAYEREVSWLPGIVNPYGEMDNILDGRDLIEEHIGLLTESELQRLAVADQRLRMYPTIVYGLLSREPKLYREKYNVPRSRWWWYVDELSNLARSGSAVSDIQPTR